jgi:hypothetical protein
MSRNVNVGQSETAEGVIGAAETRCSVDARASLEVDQTVGIFLWQGGGPYIDLISAVSEVSGRGLRSERLVPALLGLVASSFQRELAVVRFDRTSIPIEVDGLSVRDPLVRCHSLPPCA